MQRVVELARELLGAHPRAEQVRPADVADEERVARQHRLAARPTSRGRTTTIETDSGVWPGVSRKRSVTLAHADLVAVVHGDVRRTRPPASAPK